MNNDSDMGLFEPEVVLPAQMTSGARLDGDTSGARALMLAILEDAALCIERGRGRRHRRTRQLAGEAEAWVRSDCRKWVFSFASICDVLGFDADALRARLLSHAERPAVGARAALREVDEPSTRSGAVVRDVGLGPSGPQQFLFRDQLPTVFDEPAQDREGLRSERDHFAVAQELLVGEVQGKVPEGQAPLIFHHRETVF
ncbi:MAG TPA: hypothetical protein VMW56_06715 [Candidatus Margulisiibacteriota bacterium]|nr:hypothetical protein [Candidatus Margulisiibacteriota bacterium]